MIATKMTSVLVGLVVFCSVTAFAQDVVESPPTLEQQFSLMLQESNNYQQYEVIEGTRIRNFWQSVEDSIQAKENALTAAQQEIREQQDKIRSLEAKIDEQQQAVDAAAYDREHITVLGIDMLKSTFIITAFAIIGILLVLIAIGYGKYKSSLKLASEKTRKYEKLEEEYKDYQDKAREKQMKVKRELQTYMNKLEEMRHKNISFK